MRLILWHAWGLEGSGANVFAAAVTDELRRLGHDVLLLAQEPNPDRFDFIDGWGVIDGDGTPSVRSTGAEPAAGRAVLLRPEIGSILPSFLGEPFDGRPGKRFVDLSDEELAEYLDRNVRALEAAKLWHGCDLLFASHAFPGATIARRAIGDCVYGVVIHGSELEHAVRLQSRYRMAAQEGLEGARAVIGPSADALHRAARLFPTIADRTRMVRPGVDGRLFRPQPRPEALTRLATRLERNGKPGDPSDIDRAMEGALVRRDASALEALSFRYEEVGHDGSSARLRTLARTGRPLIGYVGRLAPQKGTYQLLEATLHLGADVGVLIAGFGPSRALLAALVRALDARDASLLEWLEEAGFGQVERSRMPSAISRLGDRLIFTGRLEHRDVPAVVTAVDVLVIPSLPPESFGMVAIEAAAGGALPLMPRHSGLAETASALEEVVGVPGLFSYSHGPDGPLQIAAGVRRLLDIAPEERRDLQRALREAVTTQWTWGHTADGLLRSIRPADRTP